eukprot:m.17920 g.17920  ORF g.17920 m.17920 type:complete len:672 (-) comp7247_c0_seq2:39-2054(-)
MGNTIAAESGESEFCPPIEIVMAVLDHCDWRDRRAILSVNKYFHSLTESSTFWRKMCDHLSHQHLVYIPQRPVAKSWKATFLHSFAAIRHTLPREQLAPLPLSAHAEAVLAAEVMARQAEQLALLESQTAAAGAAASTGAASSSAVAAAAAAAAEDSMSDPDDGGEEGLRIKFTVKVFARLRDGSNGAGGEAKREMATIPLSQRLVMLETQHKCTRHEALRLLWARDGPAENNPWADAFVEELEDEGDGEGEDKENAGKGARVSKKTVGSPRHVRQQVDAHARVGVLSVREKQIVMCAPTLGVKSFQFNRVFQAGLGQVDVYDHAASGIVADAINGINGCVFTYGQTGSGKTYTMFGPDDKASTTLTRITPLSGIAPRAIAEIFHAISTRTSAVDATVRMAYVEVFGDEVTDLLRDGAPLAAWHGLAARTVHEGLADFTVPTLAEAEEHLQRAEGAKRRAATAMNDRSSRAHSILMVTLEQTLRTTGQMMRSRLCIADLGGSEQIKKSQVSGGRLVEAVNINLGLLALKTCITALRRRKSHVPFNDSMLTMLLQDSFVGASNVAVVVTGNTDPSHTAETVNALRFGEMCGRITHEGVVERSTACDAIAAINQEIAELEEHIRVNERWESRVVVRQDLEGEERLTITVPVGAEAERTRYEGLLAARRELLGM